MRYPSASAVLMQINLGYAAIPAILTWVGLSYLQRTNMQSATSKINFFKADFSLGVPSGEETHQMLLLNVTVP